MEPLGVESGFGQYIFHPIVLWPLFVYAIMCGILSFAVTFSKRAEHAVENLLQKIEKKIFGDWEDA